MRSPKEIASHNAVNRERLGTDWKIERLEGLMRSARHIAKSGTCARRQIGCVLTNLHLRVAGTGFNESPWGNCRGNVRSCPDAHIPAGDGANKKIRCYAIHAEVAAIGQAIYNGIPPLVCISTKAPCTSCTGLLYKNGCEVILFDTPSNEKDNELLFPGIFETLDTFIERARNARK